MMKWHSIFHYSKLSINCPSGMYVYMCVRVSARTTELKIHPSSFTTIHIALRLSWVRNLSLFRNDKMRHSSRSTNRFMALHLRHVSDMSARFLLPYLRIHHAMGCMAKTTNYTVIHMCECVRVIWWKIIRMSKATNASKWNQSAKGSVRTKPYADIKFS